MDGFGVVSGGVKLKIQDRFIGFLNLSFFKKKTVPNRRDGWAIGKRNQKPIKGKEEEECQPFFSRVLTDWAWGVNISLSH